MATAKSLHAFLLPRPVREIASTVFGDRTCIFDGHRILRRRCRDALRKGIPSRKFDMAVEEPAGERTGVWRSWRASRCFLGLSGKL